MIKKGEIANVDSTLLTSVESDSSHEESKPKEAKSDSDDELIIMPDAFIPLVRNPKFEFVPYSQ
jgi:hypothetical protein